MNYTPDQAARIMYAAGHLISSIMHPDSPHSGDERDLAFEVFEQIAQELTEAA